MNNSIKISVIKARQPIGEVYIGKIDAQNLLRMSYIDRRHINQDDEVLGIQRPLKPDKVREIKKYLSTPTATFPNSIIVNVEKKNVKLYQIEGDNYTMELENSGDTFTIIDGQHRLFGFDGNYIPNFELILSIFIGLDVSLQSEVFSIINSEQTKVDPSLNINLELSEETETPRKKLVQIAQAFNIDKESPWYQQIKMLGGQSDGFISLAAFVRPLFDLTYPERLRTEIKIRLKESYPKFPNFDGLDVDVNRYPFWSFYASQNPSMIYKILFNYFSALKQVLSDDWMNQDSILNKTSGYNAIMKLFKVLFRIGLEQHNLTEQYFLNKLSPLSEMSGNIVPELYGTSGLYSTNKLYKDFLDKLYLQDALFLYREHR